MKSKLITITIIFVAFLNMNAQELLLVYEEDFKNKTFRTQDNPTGEITWIKEPGSGFQYEDVTTDLETLGDFKEYRLAPTEDELIYFIRHQNFISDANGLTIEANYHGDNNSLGKKAISGGLMTFPYKIKRGYMEVKAKLPKGTGIMSSWFMFSTRNQIGYGCEGAKYDSYGCLTKPAGNEQDINWQEIDIWETNGHWPKRLRNNIHWSAALPGPTYGASDSGDADCNHKGSKPYGDIGFTKIDFTEDYHTFGLYWDQMYVILLIDGDIYRYWIKPAPLLKQFGNPDPLLFQDAMLPYLGVGYGTQYVDKISGFPKKNNGDFRDKPRNKDNLFGPHPDDIPSSSLDIDYVKYWTFLPCENQKTIEIYPMVDAFNTYNTINYITNYNKVNHGYYETGKEVFIDNSDVLPAYWCAYEGGNTPIPWGWGEQLNLVASKRITLKPGFHAKNTKGNIPVSKTFTARIQTCKQLPADQDMPLINNLSNDPNKTFVEDFSASMENMIYKSYKLNGNFRKALIESTTESALVVYPNPTTNKSTVQIERKVKNNEVFILELYDDKGIKLETLNFIENTIDIQLDKYKEGLYFIKVSNGMESYTKKIIKK